MDIKLSYQFNAKFSRRNNKQNKEKTGFYFLGGGLLSNKYIKMGTKAQ